ncbi:DinB family protein [Bacillus sp. EAC]|uniref:DinB family protein n=1 Tax=Bacillus sp. EAC TaxID=1978338 RepID=UPI000B43B3D8|nr:DinB family protein [Bacillus sp. EAC]
MKQNLFDQLEFIRSQTLEAMEGVTEELADRIPLGFRNTIRWQLGHIYTVTEFLAFLKLNLSMNLPEGFLERFPNGKSPLDDIDDSVPLPTLAELESLLKGQHERVREALTGRLNERAPTLTTSTGLDLNTPEEMIRYNLYHEGLHFGIITVYKKLLS